MGVWSHAQGNHTVGRRRGNSGRLVTADRRLHGCRIPHRLIGELVRQGRKDLTVIANDTARPGVGIGRPIDAKLVRTLIVSHIGTNPETQRQMIAGDITVDLVPQGTLAERIRAAGHGLGGVLTPTGVGTLVAESAEAIVVDGKTFFSHCRSAPTSRLSARTARITSAT